MKNVYTWAAKPAKRTITVGDLKAAKGKRKFTQVTANSAEEAEAAEKARLRNRTKAGQGSKQGVLRGISIA